MSKDIVKYFEVPADVDLGTGNPFQFRSLYVDLVLPSLPRKTADDWKHIDELSVLETCNAGDKFAFTAEVHAKLEAHLPPVGSEGGIHPRAFQAGIKDHYRAVALTPNKKPVGWDDAPKELPAKEPKAAE